jgi:hypothetical protein
MKDPRLILACIVFVALGCGGDKTSPRLDQPAVGKGKWSPIAETEMTAEQKKQLDQAVVATDTMAKLMMGELKAELESGGPAGAVTVCRDLAPMIADHVGEEHNLQIGRTSHKLRNQNNLAPEWAAGLIAERSDRPGYLVGADGELGVLLPIRLLRPCAACHGEPDAMDESVLTALSESYPNDQAVGFAAGDLRGWFWVEVPNRS